MFIIYYLCLKFIISSISKERLTFSISTSSYEVFSSATLWEKGLLREKTENLLFHQFPLKKFDGYFLQFLFQNQSLAVMEGMAWIKNFLFLQAFVLWKVFAHLFFKFVKVGDNDCDNTPEQFSFSWWIDIMYLMQC